MFRLKSEVLNLALDEIVKEEPRAGNKSFWCIDAWKGDWVRLDKCAYMAPLGIEHFFDVFCFDPQRPSGAAAIQALGIPSCHVSEDTHLENMHANTFSLTPRRIPVKRKTPAAKREVDQDMAAREESVRGVGQLLHGLGVH